MARDLRRFLLGTWQLTRRIDDRRSSVGGQLIGVARLRPDADALSYVEEGTLSFGDWHGDAHQAYRFVVAGSWARVCFRDGRPFHDLDLSSGSAAVAHACGADLYRGRYRILDDARWTLAWRITGPRKDIVIGSVYRRLAHFHLSRKKRGISSV